MPTSKKKHHKKMSVFKLDIKDTSFSKGGKDMLKLTLYADVLLVAVMLVCFH